MKIFIAGCGRTGTTALQRQMAGLTNTVVHDNECSFSELVNISDHLNNVVMKRKSDSYATLHEIPNDIRLLYCVRHPFDCLTSSHQKTNEVRRFHITPDRWIKEFEALELLEQKQPDRKICIVKYEELVRGPSFVQKEIEGFLGLPFDVSFGENWPLFDTSIGKWRSNISYLPYLNLLPNRINLPMMRYCKRFGYEIGALFRLES